jgi:hypothetical protein
MCTDLLDRPKGAQLGNEYRDTANLKLRKVPQYLRIAVYLVELRT